MHGANPDQASPRVPEYPSKLGSYGRKFGLGHAVVAIPEEVHDPLDSMWNGVKRSSAPGHDTTSIASSTHFTVVNGYTKHRPDKGPRSCCCDHSHQITVLVISMTILFSACILAAICFVESEYKKQHWLTNLQNDLQIFCAKRRFLRSYSKRPVMFHVKQNIDSIIHCVKQFLYYWVDGGQGI